ncbi:phage distal tail protein [Yinghuangia soli]|uniref:Phage tail family protein n=1 Tax=Yinghuangia soli TaxID=2908204 RepID=A0AA41U4B7_9ACTN|nr:phage tail domain-containing protein [Yinghuangia soli]MCF2532725.1 phage tail family protein [Yinghuangia soli]
MTAAPAVLASAPGSLLTEDGQLEWNGLVVGPGTPFQLAAEGLTGWADLPGIDFGDANRPAQHGAWAGEALAQPRTVGATVWILADSPGEAADLLDAFCRATALGRSEDWLAVRTHGRTHAVRGRVAQRVVPLDRQYARNGVAKAAVQWVCTDPRRYTPDEATAETPLPQRGLGMPYPLVYPVGYGDPGASGSVDAENTGNAGTYPVITVTGPVRMPRIVNQATGLVLEYDIELGAGERLTVDTAEGTVQLGAGASRLHTATVASAPEQAWTLVPGRNPVVFRAPEGGAGARASLRWRSAFL